MQIVQSHSQKATRSRLTRKLPAAQLIRMSRPPSLSHVSFSQRSQSWVFPHISLRHAHTSHLHDKRGINTAQTSLSCLGGVIQLQAAGMPLMLSEYMPGRGS